MTLKEAYELLRREVLSLRRENARLKEGTYVDADRLAHEKDHPPNRYYRDGFNLLKRLIEYRDSHLYFLRHPEVEYTNNFAERQLRKFKRKQHQAVTFRSADSIGWLCDCLSVIETGRLQGANIFELATSAFSPQPK